MSDRTTFLREYLGGRARSEDLDEWVDSWDRASGIDVWDFVGMHQSEWELWVFVPESLDVIGDARRNGVSVEQFVENADYSRTDIAAARAWLVGTGRIPATMPGETPR